MNKNTIIILVTIVVFLIIGAAYLILPSTTPPEDQLKETPEEDVVEDSEREVNKTLYVGDFRVDIIEEELKINAKLLFKVGEEYEYHFISKNTDIHYLYIVEEIKIYGRDYYAIRTTGWGKQKSDKWEEIPKGEGRVWLYYDKETGKAFIKTDENKLKDLESDSEKGLFVEYWMLALNDDFKWIRMRNTTGLGVHYEKKHLYEVVGREKFKGRGCFKVEIKITDLKSNNTIEKTILWIDIETRVLIKKVVYEDNISSVENNLLSAPFLGTQSMK